MSVADFLHGQEGDGGGGGGAPALVLIAPLSKVLLRIRGAVGDEVEGEAAEALVDLGEEGAEAGGGVRVIGREGAAAGGDVENLAK